MKAIPPAVSLLLILGLGAAAVVQTVNVSQLKRQLAVVQSQAAERQDAAAKADAELAHMREQNEVFKTESETLRQRLATIDPSLLPKRTATTAAAAPGETAAASKETEQSDAGRTEASSGGGGEMMKNVAKMFSDPEMRKVIRTQQAMAMRMMYGDLAKELSLSPAETDSIMDLLADRQMGMSEKSMELMGNGGKIDAAKMEEIGKATNSAREQFDAKLKEELGPDRFTKFQDYEKTVGDRFVVQQYSQQFASYGAPLQDDQRDGLMRIMSEERTKTSAPNFVDPNNKDVAAQMKMLQSDEAMHSFLASQEDYNRRVLERAAEVLTPEQMQSFKTIQANWSQMMQAGMKMNRQMLK